MFMYDTPYVPLKPLSHQTAMPQRLYSVLKTCQRAVGTPRNSLKISNLPVIACTQSPHSVPSAPTRRFHSVFVAPMTLLRHTKSCCSVFTVRSRRAFSVLTAIIEFNIFSFFHILSNHILVSFGFSKQFVLVFNNC